MKILHQPDIQPDDLNLLAGGPDNDRFIRGAVGSVDQDHQFHGFSLQAGACGVLVFLAEVLAESEYLQQQVVAGLVHG